MALDTVDFAADYLYLIQHGLGASDPSGIPAAQAYFVNNFTTILNNNLDPDDSIDIPYTTSYYPLIANVHDALDELFTLASGSLTSPLTTVGDLWYFDTANNRLPHGSNSQLLRTNTGITDKLEWFTPANTDITGWLGFTPANIAGDTFTGLILFNAGFNVAYTGIASTSAGKFTGTPFAGTGTTSFPLLYLNQSTATASTTLNTSGTWFGINSHGTQDFFTFMIDGVAKATLTSVGTLGLAGNLTVANWNITTGSINGSANTSYTIGQNFGGTLTLAPNRAFTKTLGAGTGVASGTNHIFEYTDGFGTSAGFVNVIGGTDKGLANNFTVFGNSSAVSTGLVATDVGSTSTITVSGVLFTQVNTLGTGDRVYLSGDPATIVTVLSVPTATTFTTDAPLNTHPAGQVVYVKKAIFSIKDYVGRNTGYFIVNDLGYIGINTNNPKSYLHLNVSALASANVGTISLGGGVFDGSTTGHFVGSSYGTNIAINQTSGSAVDFINFQKYGVRYGLWDTNGLISLRVGSNKPIDSGTLVGGTVTISNSLVTSNSKIFLSDTGGGVNFGTLQVTSKGSGTFTVTSSNALDTSSFDYIIFNNL